MVDRPSHPHKLLEPNRALNDYLGVLLQENADSPSGEPENAPCSSAGETDSARGVAAWAYPKFQAQLFTVGRLQLAIPVSKLHGVVAWSDGIQAQADQPSWCHGSLSYQDGTVSVVDTAALVLPADRRELMPALRPAYILIVGNGCWGLACHSVSEVVHLAWDEVKWRSERGRRPWLAGTALGRGCAVLDSDAFAELLG